MLKSKRAFYIKEVIIDCQIEIATIKPTLGFAHLYTPVLCDDYILEIDHFEASFMTLHRYPNLPNNLRAFHFLPVFLVNAAAWVWTL